MALKRQITRRLLLNHDGLRAHRCRLVRDYMKSLDGDIVPEWLSGCASGSNAVEYVFDYAKRRELTSPCVSTIGEAHSYAMWRLKSTQCRPAMFTAFWKQAELPM